MYSDKSHGVINAFGANTHQGLSRNYNEDKVTIITNIEKPKQKAASSPWPLCSFFAIYDGHGGHKCANFLKENLHTIIINQTCFPQDPAKAMTLGCAEAERRFVM